MNFKDSYDLIATGSTGDGFIVHKYGCLDVPQGIPTKRLIAVDLRSVVLGLFPGDSYFTWPGLTANVRIMPCVGDFPIMVESPLGAPRGLL